MRVFRSTISFHKTFFVVLTLLFLNFEKAYLAIRVKDPLASSCCLAPSSRSPKITEAGTDGLDAPKLTGDEPPQSIPRYTPDNFESYYTIIEPLKSTLSKAWSILSRKSTTQTKAPTTPTLASRGCPASSSRPPKIIEARTDGLNAPKLTGDEPPQSIPRYTPDNFKRYYTIIEPQKYILSKAWSILSRKLTTQTKAPTTPTLASRDCPASSSRPLKITEAATDGLNAPKPIPRYTPDNFKRYYTIIEPQESTLSQAWSILSQKSTTQTKASTTPTSWSSIYDVGTQVLGSSEFLNIQGLIQEVTTGRRNYFAATHSLTKFYIVITYQALQNSLLNNFERMWAVGLLSYLKSRFPEKDFAKISFGPEPGSSSDRGWGDLDLVLLEKFDLMKVLWQMLEGCYSQDQIPNETILEAMQRESLIYNSLKANAFDGTSPEFDDILRCFINLGTPINSNYVSLLMVKIENFLHEDRTPEEGSSVSLEEEYAIRMLFHMEEHCYERNIYFKKMNPYVHRKIVQLDMKLQLEDESLSPILKRILQQIKHTKHIDKNRSWDSLINENNILEALEAISCQELPIPQRGRLFRLLNLLLQGNQSLACDLTLRLNRNPTVLPNIAEMLLIYHHYRIDANWFQVIDLQYYIYKKIQDGLAESDRHTMETKLVAKKLLLESETTLSLPEGTLDSDEARKGALNGILHSIFKKLSTKLKEKTFTGYLRSFIQQKKDDEKRLVEQKKYQADVERLIDYIIDLISLKNDDVYLYQNLVNKNSQFINKLRSKITSLARGHSCSEFGTLIAFEKALKRLEKEAIDLGRSWAKELE